MDSFKALVHEKKMRKDEKRMHSKPVLYIVIPCYNEEKVLPITSHLFLEKLLSLENREKVGESSRILLVDDGSSDGTWHLIQKLSDGDCHFSGIRLSRNRGHQNALLAGLMEAAGRCDITISIDCDGQDDINAMDKMVEEYLNGYEIVYGVRSSRETDTVFKRATAQTFYRLLSWMGADVVYNHADYRLVSARVLREFKNFKEVNIFLRGMFPLIGFRSTCVTYKRNNRMAGKSHYSLGKMLSLAADGITSLSVKPLQIVLASGILMAGVSFLGILWAVAAALMGKAVSGWASIVCIMCFLGGIQLTVLGIIGEYVGKIYLETKGRPRFILSDRAGDLWEKENEGREHEQSVELDGRTKETMLANGSAESAGVAGMAGSDEPGL